MIQWLRRRESRLIESIDLKKCMRSLLFLTVWAPIAACATDSRVNSVPTYTMTLHQGNRCDLCDKALQVIHCERANGRSHRPDWRGRCLHKKCFRELCRSWPSHVERTIPRMLVVARYLKAHPSDERMRLRVAKALRVLVVDNCA